MHPKVYRRFEALFEAYPPPGPRILEIGASSFPDDSLLTAFRRLSSDFVCTGVNLEVPAPVALPYRMVQCDANDMAVFEAGSFDGIACNAVLEHDRRFWSTLAEVRRLLVAGGMFYVGVPGFPRRKNIPQRLFTRVPRSRLASVAILSTMVERAALTSLAATRTLMFHAHPDDYYRFSEQAVRQVFLEDLDCVHLEYVLKPVRILAVGRKRPA